MELGSVLILKLLLASALWTFGWTMRFIYTGADPNFKNMIFLLWPWILMILYVFIFWWG